LTVRVGIVDYEMGNLRSVAKAVEATGAKAVVSSERKTLEKTDVLLVPGVGAFGAALAALRRRKLDGFLRGWVKEERPYLGICLGLQLLFESSEESPGVKGLGLLEGRVRRFRPRDRRLKVPHIGWNPVTLTETPAALQGHYYFVHSYYPDPEDTSLAWGRTEYGAPFCSAVRRRSLWATQFHPEKSGTRGLQLLRFILKGGGS
jgi:imidazole glycerol phosphate synthase glutamine amidotransferase subunit